MKFKQLKTYLVKELKIDEKHNAIIKVLKGTTHIVLKKGVPDMKQGRKEPTTKELILSLTKVVNGISTKVDSIDERLISVESDIKSMKETPTMKKELTK